MSALPASSLARPLPAPGRVLLETGWCLLATPSTGQEMPPEDADWLPIAGPMPVAAALAAAGRWPDDEARAPDLDAGTWWFRCRFDRPGADGDWLLGLDGLATLAQVWLNGEHLLDSRNMFRAHQLALGDRLRAQGNELLIRCDPLNAALAQRRPRPRWRVPMVSHQQLRWWRTTLLGRTPGWSPPVAVVGPWQPVWLAPALPWRCVALGLNTRLQGDAGLLAIRLAWADDRGLTSVQASLRRVGATADEPAHLLALQRGPDGSWAGELNVPQVRRWWPHTHGEPVLYALSLQLQAEPGLAAPATLDAGRVGFRELQIDRSDDGFRVVVNGVPVFARGACWTPQDSRRLHVSAEHYRALLGRLRQAGLNMLRVGGTMAYESEDFLAACDEHGILLWQELMFASMDYPGDDPEFAAEVQAEVAQQLARWQARPALALVCGNSEVDQQAAMWGAPRPDWSPALFHQQLPAQVAAALPGVAYWPSSAHGGAFPFQPSSGTTSYYGVGAYRRPLADARESQLRFATECLAFANLPDDATLARLRELNGGLPAQVQGPLWKTRSPRDLGAGWDFDDVRDHYLAPLFGEPADALRSHDPQRHRLLGRVAVAELMRGAFDHWRAAGSRCGGALVWFLRDLWAGAGWGVLDDEAQPKSAFHALARCWQPQHLGLVDDGLNGFTLHLAHEGPAPLAGRVTLSLLRDGATPVAQGEQALTLPGRSVQALPAAALLPDFVDATWAYRFGPPVADVLVARWWRADGQLLAERLHFLPATGAPPRQAVGLSVQALARPDGSRWLRLRCERAVRGLMLDSEAWQADADGQDLAPDRDYLWQLKPRPGAGAQPPWRLMLQCVNGLAPVVVPPPVAEVAAAGSVASSAARSATTSASAATPSAPVAPAPEASGTHAASQGGAA